MEEDSPGNKISKFVETYIDTAPENQYNAWHVIVLPTLFHTKAIYLPISDGKCCPFQQQMMTTTWNLVF